MSRSVEVMIGLRKYCRLIIWNRWFDLAFCLVFNFIQITRNFAILRESRALINFEEGGYGHTVTVSDIARRLFKLENPVVIISSENKRHNWKQAKIWPDVKIIHLRKGFRYRTLVHKNSTRVLCKCTLFLLQRLSDVRVLDVRMLYGVLEEKYRASQNRILQPASTPVGHKWDVYYNRLVSDISAGNLFLPDPIREEFQRSMRTARPDSAGIITFYHRVKTRGGVSSVRRCGGVPDDYRAMINFLAQGNYIVLLTGDTVIADWPEDLGYLMYDAEKLGMDENWFQLASVLECNRFIGEAGGGIWLPMILGIPSLHINVWPYASGYPNTLLLFKRIISDGNKVMPIEECLRKHLWIVNEEMPEGLSIENNSSSDMLAAAKEFLSVPRDEWSNYVVPQDIFPKGGLAHEAPSRLAKIQENT